MNRLFERNLQRMLPVAITWAAVTFVSRAKAAPPADTPGVPSNRADAPAADAPTSGTAPESAQLLEARETFRLGAALAQQGQWLNALAAFQRSAELKPHAVTTYNIAYCERALGRVTRAYRSFSAVLRASVQDPDSGVPPDMHAQVRAYLAESKEQLVRVTVALADPRLPLRVDGRSLVRVQEIEERLVFTPGSEESASESRLPPVFELWLDPGTHVFVTGQANEATAVESHVFKAGTTGALRIPRSALVRRRPPLPSAARDGRPSPRAAPDRRPAVVAFGIGGLGLLGGSVFAALALKDKSELDAEACPDRQCPPAHADKMREMKRFSHFATVGLGVALAGAGVGTYFWLSANGASSSKPSERQPAVTACVGPRSLGVSGRF